ncbi:Aminopeptidase N [Planctomycetes bacterium Pla163]|uniref:Aminopeptidase N n=1 Tax=Rohdeia mirabilis TaxID=2528008 RepID=A0A518CZP6_9BACT|nr:Aminopeptidase N [Planctomycetes bacterium Pla163]
MLRALFLALICAGAPAVPAVAQDATPAKQTRPDAFRQLDELLPTPNDQRLASGAPGPGYWQQKVDYRIAVEIDDATQRITGEEWITYHNRSPHRLDYLWVQIDNNIFAPHSESELIGGAPDMESMSYSGLRRLMYRRSFDGGVDIASVKDAVGDDLPHTINGTMMRVDLPSSLQPGAAVEFSIRWSYSMNPSDLVGGRTAAEYFEEDDNWIYELAHWFPRLAPYTDVNGWQNKQFLGRGEFALEFGDYEVAITAPSDHVVAATGVLQNAGEVLTQAQRDRLEEARTAEKPVFVITPDEAVENQGTKATDTKTWVFHAQNVRDFAWASSRKFIWDAWGTPIGDRTVMSMSYWPIEGEPLWSRYSTQAIAHTLEVYSKFTFDYPYPVAISVNGPVGGMEYPMICFNGPRPEKDGTYTSRTKYGLIGVIIHEVGHNWFPMIVNSDERQWTWMDEGLNTFVQYLAEQEWEPGYPSRRGEARNITGFMSSTEQVPIMTNSESILQFGANAYAKPATALNVLRETVMGRELFDFAFKQYARRWMFKRPEPADLFRTLEDASAVDLDWFWRGWFYTTDHVDLAITGVESFQLESPDPKVAKANDRADEEARAETPSERLNAPLPKRTDRFPELLDFYNSFDEHAVTLADRKAFERLMASLDDDEKQVLEVDQSFTVVSLENLGGLVSPVVLELELTDGSTEILRIPAELWRRNSERVETMAVTDLPVVRVTLDPFEETADVDTANNHWPPRTKLSRFQLFKRDRTSQNPMQQARDEAAELEAEADAEPAGDDSASPPVGAGER